MFETIELLSVPEDIPQYILNHLRQPILKRIFGQINELPELTGVENNHLLKECCTLLGWDLRDFLEVKNLSTDFSFGVDKLSVSLEFRGTADYKVTRIKELFEKSKLNDIVKYDINSAVYCIGKDMFVFLEEKDPLSINAQLIYLLEIVFTRKYFGRFEIDNFQFPRLGKL